MYIYGLFDCVAYQFISVSLEANDGVAVRNLMSAIESSKERQSGLLYSHVQDFSLYRLASLEHDSKEIKPCTFPEEVFSGRRYFEQVHLND